MSNQAEVILLEGLKEGNKQIFDYLFHHYYSGLVVFANKHINKPEVAEDIVQDFFYKLWIKREKLQINQTIKNYFFTSIKNRCIDYLRHNELQQKTNDYFKQAELEQLTDETDFIIESELKEHIDAALNKLPEKCRQVFIMNRFDGLSPKEIAEKEEISIRTVEGHIGKALKIMRKELETYLPEFMLLFVLYNNGINKML